MVYYTTISIALGCFAATAALTPLVMVLARRIDAVDRGGFRKVFQGEMPLLGGLGVATPVLIVCVALAIAGHLIVQHWQWFWIHWRDSFDFIFTLAGNRTDFLIFAVGAFAILLLGVVDDKVGLSARWKFLGQIVVAAFVSLAGGVLTSVTIPFAGAIEFGPVLGFAVTMIWIVGLINAFNLIDGIDGLASSMALMSGLALLLLSIIQGNLFVTIACAALTGSLAAFLLYNFPPAKIFLGDTGSMFLGYALSVTSLTGSQKSEAAVIILAPILALSLPIFDTAMSILRRYVNGLPVFVGDKHHTHHRLLGKGYSQPKVVLMLSGMSLLLTAAAILSALVPAESSWTLLPIVLYALTLLTIAWMAGYLRPTKIKVLIERRDRNLAFHALGRYARLRFHGNPGFVEPAALLEICRMEMGLDYLEVRISNDDCILAARPTNGQVKTVEEKVRVKSLDGQDLTICFAFRFTPDDNRRQDVSACLARVFDGVQIDRLRGSNG